MTTATRSADILSRAREIRSQHAPEVTASGSYYTAPVPAAEVPSHLIPKGKAGEPLRSALTAYHEADSRLDAVTEALEDAETDLATVASWETRRNAVAARVAAGDLAALDEALPAHDADEMLARVETLAVAVKTARRTVATAATAVDDAVRVALPLIVPAAAAEAATFATEASAAEAAASAARSRATFADALVRDLHIPTALDALRRAGYRPTGGVTIAERARGLTRAALHDPASSEWTSDARLYRDAVLAAQHLAGKVVHPERLTIEEWKTNAIRAQRDGRPVPSVPDYLIGQVG